MKTEIIEAFKTLRAWLPDAFFEESEALDVIEEQLKELEAASRWQPIETAPKGESLGDLCDLGLIVDLWVENTRIPNCFWSHSKQCWLARVQYLTRGNARKTVFIQVKPPTHWRLLPQPPTP